MTYEFSVFFFNIFLRRQSLNQHRTVPSNIFISKIHCQDSWGKWGKFDSRQHTPLQVFTSILLHQDKPLRCEFLGGGGFHAQFVLYVFSSSTLSTPWTILFGFISVLCQSRYTSASVSWNKFTCRDHSISNIFHPDSSPVHTGDVIVWLQSL